MAATTYYSYFFADVDEENGVRLKHNNLILTHQRLTFNLYFHFHLKLQVTVNRSIYGVN